MFFHFVPSATGSRMKLEALLTTTQLITFLGGERKFCFLCCEAVPKIFDELQALGASKSKEFLKLAFHLAQSYASFAVGSILESLAFFGGGAFSGLPGRR